MAKIFKKQSLVDTAINVGIGGVANVAIDYAFSAIDTLNGLGSTTKNAIKIAAGVLGGSMSTDKWVRAAVDGIAVVGASELVSGWLTKTTSTSGLPQGTIGRVRTGNRYFRSGRKVSGLNGVLCD